MQHIHSIQLIPVLEIEPWDYQRTERATPGGHLRHDKSAWDTYWKESLAQSGIRSIHALIHGTYFCDMRTLSNENLRVVLTTLLREHTPDTYQDELPYLQGGVVLMADGEPLIQPQCCTHIGDYTLWKTFLDTQKQNEWSQLWVGHPWIFYYVEGEDVYFSDYTNDSVMDDNRSNAKFMVGLPVLRREVQQLDNAMNTEYHRIRDILQSMKMPFASEIAKQLLGV